jgi:hypothetical protein
VAQGIGRCFGAVGTGGLGEDVAYIAGDGTEADTEDVGDVPIALAGGKEAEHLNLGIREYWNGYGKPSITVLIEGP